MKPPKRGQRLSDDVWLWGARTASLGTPPESVQSSGMATVEITKHLWEFLPALRDKTLTMDVATVAEVVREVERIAPGFTDYICDERGCLRTHVNIFVGDERILDRARLSDAVQEDSRVLIMQALSGG